MSSIHASTATSIPGEVNQQNLSINTIEQTQSVIPNEILQDSLDLLQLRKESLGSWNLPSMTTDPTQYFGIAGGMAGIGLKLLEVADLIELNVDVEDQILAMVIEIGDELITKGSIDGTTAVWTIDVDSSTIDFGWDFGLAGIAAFYTQLYKHTQDIQYQELVEKIFNSIFDLIQIDTTLNFSTSIIEEFVGLDWYMLPEHLIYEELSPLGFTGTSIGVAGILKSLVTFLQDTNFEPDTAFNDNIFTIADFLSDQANYTGEEISFSIAIDSPANGSNFGYGLGNFGIADVYYSLYQHFDDDSYLDIATGIVNWANTSINGFPRMALGNTIEGTPTGLIELGYMNGFTAIGLFLTRIGIGEDDQEYLDLALSLANLILSYKEETSSTISLPERLNQGTRQFVGSNSWSSGSAGMYQFIFSIATEIEDLGLLNEVSKIKNQIIAQTGIENEKTAFENFFTEEIENNPYVGFPGQLFALIQETPGRLFIDLEAIDFDRVEVGRIKSHTISLENLGDTSISVSIDIEGSGFSVDTTSIQLEGKQIQPIEISFTPTSEQDYEGTITITSGVDGFTTTLEGVGFDRPTITVTSSIANETALSKAENIVFLVTVSDSTLIQGGSVRVKTNDGASTQLDGGGEINQYTYTWNSNGLVNGTYVITFSATDLSGNTGETIFVYTIGIYTPSRGEEVFSERNQNFLIYAIIFVVIAAIVVTRKYMK